MNAKMKALAKVVAAGALVASGSVSAVTIWDAKGTIGLWDAQAGNAVVDIGCPSLAWTCADHTPHVGDGDTTFTLIATNFANDTQVHFSEAVIGGIDFYNVDFEHDGSTVIEGSTITYQIDTTDPAGLNLSALGSQGFGGAATGVTKDISDAITGAHLLTLTSTDGARDPLTGYKAFTTSQHLLVTDTIQLDALGEHNVESITNEFAAPEPATLVLFGIGLVSLLARRRRT